MALLIAAISLGFLGSFHCIGMCGPIALALPVHQKKLSAKIISILTYNFGRILTYSIFGAVFGLIGQSFALFGFQQLLSVILGSLILITLILSKTSISTSRYLGKFYHLFNSLKNKMANLFSKQGISSFFSIGLLNGLLPCGLVYIALASAIATGDVLKGATFMAFFGLGTLPFMFAISITSHLFTLKTRNVIRKAMPVVIGIMAVLLILRGLNLGISYISPKIEPQETSEHMSSKPVIKCCHK